MVNDYWSSRLSNLVAILLRSFCVVEDLLRRQYNYDYEIFYTTTTTTTTTSTTGSSKVIRHTMP